MEAGRRLWLMRRAQASSKASNSTTAPTLITTRIALRKVTPPDQPNQAKVQIEFKVNKLSRDSKLAINT